MTGRSVTFHHSIFLMLRQTFLPLMLGTLFFAGCGKKGPEEMPPPPPREITVAQPLQSEGVDWDEYTGRVEAVENVEIRSRVDGYLTEVAFREGDLVKKGDLLFVIDPRPYEAEVRRTNGELERARAQRSLAQQEYERSASLHKNRAIAAADYDAKVTALQQAKAAIESAQAAHDKAKLNLEFCHIRSPIAGRVGQRMVTQGNLIEVGKQVLTTVVSRDPVHVYFDVDENALVRYQQLTGGWSTEKESNIPVELAVTSGNGFPFKGKLDFVDNRIEPGTGTIRLRGIFENKEDRLTPGLFARVRVPGSERYTAQLVPDTVIGTDQGNRFVLVIDEKDTAQYRKVELGPLRDGLRVIRDGLKPGERIATTGLQLVQPGMTVIPKPVSLKTSPTAATQAEQPQ